MGVWIETVDDNNNPLRTSVTPFVGVWIETFMYPFGYALRMSHPSWVCGLKPRCNNPVSVVGRHTLRGCVD